MFILRGLEWLGMKATGSWSNPLKCFAPGLSDRRRQQEQGVLPHPPLNSYKHIQESSSSVPALSADKYVPCQECFILLLSLLPRFLTGSPTRLYWSKCGWAAGLGCSNRGMWWGRDKLVSSRARHREEMPGLTAQQRVGEFAGGTRQSIKNTILIQNNTDLKPFNKNRVFPLAKRITPILKISHYFSLSFFHSHCD